MRIFFVTVIMFIAFFASAQYRNIQIHAAGLTCSLCSNAIQKALKGLPFVAGIQTELKSNIFTLDIRPGIPVDLDLISKKVEEAGFSVGKLLLEVKFTPVEAKNDVHVVVGGQPFHFLNIQPKRIEGWQRVQLLDKNFVLSGEAKKNAKLTTMACFKSGYRASCCPAVSGAPSKRIYHITI